jgi:soluble lytic murein transglycosylase-like protein
MFDAQSTGETIGAALGTSALSVRETRRSPLGMARTTAALLLAVLLGGTFGTAFAAQQQPTEQAAAEPPAIGDILDEGIARYHAGAPAHAIDVFLSAAETDPTAALPWIWAGIAATAAGKMPDANRYFKHGLAQSHTSYQDRIIRGWLSRLTVFTEAPRPVKRGTPQAIAALARATNPHLTPAQAEWLGERVVAAARQQHVDPWLVAAVIYVESRFDQASVSRRGAMGLGQLMPHTARAAGVNPRDPWGNLLGTAMTLSGCIREFGDWRLALAAYNAGSTSVYRYRGIPPYAETRWYVTAVLTIYQRIRPG